LLLVIDFGSDILGEQDVCRHEEAVGLHWKTTNAGSFDEIPCPKKAKGKFTNVAREDGNSLLILLSYFQVWQGESVQLNHIGFYQTLVPVLLVNTKIYTRGFVNNSCIDVSAAKDCV
jgi:hypothetical protein